MQGNPTKIGTGLSQEIAGRPALLKGIWSPEKKSHESPGSSTSVFFERLVYEFHQFFLVRVYHPPKGVSPWFIWWKVSTSRVSLRKCPLFRTKLLTCIIYKSLCLLSVAGGVLHRVFGLSRGVMPLRMPVRKLRGGHNGGTGLKDFVMENWYPVSLRILWSDVDE